MLISQPNTSLGQILSSELDARNGTDLVWTDFAFAVAWINRSGANFLDNHVRRYLRDGGRIRITVGLDFAGTTIEGLQTLLDWCAVSKQGMEVHVYKNEWGGSTFHPKVFLMTNSTNASLIIGSNNLTGAGLATNVEAAVRLDCQASDPIVKQVQKQLAEWRTPGPLVKRLDAALMKKLVDGGYTQSESAAKAARVSIGTVAMGKTPRIFGTQSLSSPKAKVNKAPGSKSSGQTPISSTPVTVVHFRVRPHRESQIQLPKKLRESSFLAPASSIRSIHDGESHDILTSTRQGKFNYYYFEAPEVRSIQVGNLDGPVMRLFWKNDTLWYEAFDSRTSGGMKVLANLQDGLQQDPPTTFESKPGNQHAQWWRFIT